MNTINRCLITGATGLIGSNVIHKLEANWHIIGISHSITYNNPNIKNVQMLPIDLSMAWNANLLPNKVDAVIHLAQSEYYREFPEKAEHVFNVNTASTIRLLDYARRAGARSFVYASSGGVYGYGNQPFSENAEISTNRDLGFYIQTKISSEKFAENYTPFMNIIVLRFFFVYGPGQKETMLIPRLVKSIKNGQPITMQGIDGLCINPIHVTDAALAIRQAIDLTGHHIVNIAGAETLTLRKIVETIGTLAGKQPIFQIDINAEPRHLIGDIQKMSGLLAPPTIRFADGIKTIISNI